jgi:hypothetical protein
LLVGKTALGQVVQVKKDFSTSNIVYTNKLDLQKDLLINLEQPVTAGFVFRAMSFVYDYFSKQMPVRNKC